MPNDRKNPPPLPDNIKSHGEAKFLPPGQGPTPAAVAAAVTTIQQKLQPSKGARKTYANLTDEEKWMLLFEAFHLNRRSLLSIPGVTAVDIGYRIEDGKFQSDLAVRVHVERKLPDNLTPSKRPPYWFGKGGKPGAFKLRGYDVPTDVIEGVYRPAQLASPPRPGIALEELRDSKEVNPRRRLNPLVGGISIGSPRAPSGTLGAVVWDNRDGSACILSNWHILSGDLRVEAGTPCFQPGRLDQGRSTDIVARLKRWSFDRQTDAALAELTGSRHYCAGEILGLEQPILESTAPHLGMRVQKCGRSTGFTWGFVDGLYFSTAIEYSNGIVQVFEDQIHIAPLEEGVRMSGPGDSGTLWLTAPTEEKPYHVVGLHFAGDLPHSAFGEYALANPISIVMENLDFSFRPRFLEIRDEDVLSPPPLPFQTEDDGIVGQPIGIVGGDRLRRTGDHGDPIVVRPTGG